MEKCPITGKNCVKYKAFNVTNIENNQTTSLNICEDCLSQLNIKEIKETSETKNENTCGNCGMTIDEFLKKSRLGCAKCYDKFEKSLYLIIEKIQENPSCKELKHKGTVPDYWKRQRAENYDPYQFLLKLKQKLALSVKDEDYKNASFFKENIKNFELLINQLSDKKNTKKIKKQISNFIYNYFELEKQFKKETF